MKINYVRKLFLKMFLAFLLTKFISLPELQAQHWQSPVRIESVTGTNGDMGEYSSLLVIKGKPSIMSYGSAGNLIYIRSADSNGTSWNTPVFIDEIGDVGQHLSFQIINDTPAVSYWDFELGNLKYIRANDNEGLSWADPVIIDVPGITGEYTSLTEVNGKPAISYYDRTFGNLRFVRANDSAGNSWDVPITIDFIGDVGKFTSLKTVNGNPAIAYYDETNGNLKYVRAIDSTGTSWNLPLSLDSNGDVGQYSSLQIINGNPAISYYDSTNGNLKYIRAIDNIGNLWGSALNVDISGDAGRYTSLHVVKNNPAISYYINSSSEVKYVRSNDINGSSWPSPISLESWLTVGQYTSLEVVNGYPAVSYTLGNGMKLKYKRATDSTGVLWSPSLSFECAGASGASTSTKIIKGKPAVAFYDQTNQLLKYVRANDSLGITWPIPITLDLNAGIAYYGVSLEVINGYPAISYLDLSNDHLKYIRANDSLGLTWGTPVVVDVGSLIIYGIGMHSYLADVWGFPAISYYDSYYGNLKYVRANDSVGSSWGVPLIIDALGDVGDFTSIKIVNGFPAISYYGNSNLRFVRAADSTGTSWGTPVVVDNLGDAGQYSSLEIINGKPAISYIGENILLTDGKLKFVKSIDSIGSSWNSPIILDTNYSSSSCLKVINGFPAITYFSHTSLRLKYIKSNNPSGTSWDLPINLTNEYPWGGHYPSMTPMGSGAGISFYWNSEGYPYFITGLPCTNINPTTPEISSYNQTVCPNNNSTLLTITSGELNSADNWQWYTNSCGEINIGSGTAISVSPSSTTTYYARAEGECVLPGNCDSVTVTVLPVPIVDLGSDITQCGGNVMLDAGNSGTIHEWSFTSDTSQTQLILQTGTYSVYVIDSNNCTNSDTVSITINNTYPSVSLGPDITQCDGNIVLNAGNPGSTYVWYPFSTNQSINVTQTGTYSVTVTNSQGCSDSDTVDITINPNPNINTSLNGNSILANQSGAIYQWLDCNNGSAAISGEINQNYTPQNSGIYAVSITLNGCTDTSACVNFIGTGLNEQGVNGLNIYPNPGFGEIIIESTDGGEFLLTNELGQTVLIIRFTENQNFIKINNVNPGVYYIIGLKNNSFVKQKIIVIK